MFYHKESNTYIQLDVGFTVNGITYPDSWLRNASMEARLAIGLEEVITNGVREDERYYFVSEVVNGAVKTIVNTPKPIEMINQMKQEQILNQIDQLEKESMLPRITREFLLQLFADKSSSTGLNLVETKKYQKLQELENQISALRSQL